MTVHRQVARWLDTVLFVAALALAAGSGSLAGATLARTQAAIDQTVLCNGWAMCVGERGASPS